MVVVPNSRIRLLKSPIELDEKNQLTFANLTAQTNYFLSLPYLEYDGNTYQRKDGVIRVETDPVGTTYEDLLGYNYCMYQNTAYDNKWFYAFVTEVTYKNDGTTDIKIETDVLQTWKFDINYRQSFIEREHVSDDTIGKHTLPENLETGDYISCNLQPTGFNLPTTCFVVATTEQITPSYATFNQLLPIGLYYYGLTTLQGIKDLIAILDGQGRGDTVNAVFVTLKDFFYDWGTNQDIDGQISASVRFDYSNNIVIQKVNYLGDNYVPKNNKLLTYPYSFLQVSNNTGQVVNYRWENFNLITAASDGTIKFNINGTITPGGSIKAIPVNYNNMVNSNDDDIVLGKLPIGAYNNDVYTNWITQNGVNIGINALSSALQIGGGVGLIASGGGALAGAGNIATGLGGIANTLASVYQHALIPDSVSGNVNSGDVNFTIGLTSFMFKRMSIKNEYAKIIDDYFSMFGYKVNTIKVPTFETRTNWNYIKTIGLNITGDIPQNDMQKIKDIFDNGVTFWHNPSTFLDYSQSNAIVS